MNRKKFSFSEMLEIYGTESKNKLTRDIKAQKELIKDIEKYKYKYYLGEFITNIDIANEKHNLFLMIKIHKEK